MAFKVKDLMINIAGEAAAAPMMCIEGVSCDVGRTGTRPIPCACTGDYTCGWSQGPITVFYAQGAQGAAGVAGIAPRTCFAGNSCDVGRTDVRPIPCACTGDYTCGISHHPITVFYAQPAAQGAMAGVTPGMPICHVATVCLCSIVGITFITPGLCPGATVIGPVPVPIGGDPATQSQQLAALKAQLQQAVAEIEKQQTTVDASLQPQTVAQVEDLQAKMRDALDELDKRKAELQQKQS